MSRHTPLSCIHFPHFDFGEIHYWNKTISLWLCLFLFSAPFVIMYNLQVTGLNYVIYCILYVILHCDNWFEYNNSFIHLGCVLYSKYNQMITEFTRLGFECLLNNLLYGNATYTIIKWKLHNYKSYNAATRDIYEFHFFVIYL